MSHIGIQGSKVPLPVSGVAALPSVPSPRLVSAAHEFEAAIMKELLAPMQPGNSTLGSDSDESSSSPLGSFAGDALGKAISESGGFGIAKSILRQLSAESNHSGNRAIPTKENGTNPNSPFIRLR